MKLIFGPQGYSWACKELTDGLINMQKCIEDTAHVFCSKHNDKDVTIFVVMACPCCERTDMDDAPKGSIFVTPFKGIDLAGHKVEMIDIYPPHRNRDGVKEARNKEQFAAHWNAILEKAIA